MFYTWPQSEAGPKFDQDFGRMIEWDIPLLDGYEFEFVDNVAKNPGPHHFKGINNPSLERRIEDWNPDVLLVVGWNYKSHLGIMRHFKGRVPILFKGDSTLIDERPGIRRLLRRIFLKWVYWHIDYALYVGENNKAYFLAHGIKESQLYFVPHAVDNDRFAEPHEEYEKAAGKWRAELGISDNDAVFLFAGKLEPKKNPGFMLKMARSILSEHYKFVIVGNGILEDELKKDAANDKRIIFLGFQNQQIMPVLYRVGDIFVLPSTGPGETWGLSINEAMACKRPVIVSRKVGCAPDLVVEGKTGWIAETDSKNGETLMFKLSDLLGEENKFRPLGENAFEKIKQYSYSVAIENFLELMITIGNRNVKKSI